MKRATVSATEYHERTNHSPRSVRESAHQLDRSNKPIPYKIYENAPTVSLPRKIRPPQLPTLAVLGGVAGQEPPAVSFDALAQLCYYATGITRTIRRNGREHQFRAASCTGALYHVDLYLVCGDLDALSAGVYHFDPRTLSLDVLREGDYRGALADATDGEEAVSHAPATVVATSTWWRNAWKYRERTYRHAFWDSGTVLANLGAVARAMGLPTRVVLGFADEQVTALLGLDIDGEAPLELVPIGRSSEEVPDAPDVEPIDPETRPLSAREIQYDLIGAAYAGSAFSDGKDAREWRERRPTGTAVGRRAPGDGDRVNLDPVGDDRASKTPLHATITRRGSCRKYSRDELDFRKVSTVLDRAVRGFDADVRDPDGPTLQFTDPYLVVHDVAAVPAGAYHYHPEEGTLELLREGEFRREAAHLALDQRLAGDAALCVFFMTDLGAITEQFGDRGYRVAQFEAALAAGNLYLATYAHRDLGGTGLTFYDDAVTEFFSPRAAGQTPMFLYTMGRPA